MLIFFEVIDFPRSGIAPNTVYLTADSWNDHNYHTLFTLTYLDELGEAHKIGDVKIGKAGMWATVPPTDGMNCRTQLKETFDSLSKSYFSLGQDESYYRHLSKLCPEIRERILRGLRDIAFDPEQFEIAKEEDVTGVSLMRTVSRESVEGYLRQLAHGVDEQQPGYSFSFYYPSTYQDQEQRHLLLNFEIVPNSSPPSNIHVLIGRNGVGKTTLLDAMAHAIIDGRTASELSPHFQFKNSTMWFANVGFVSFSPFDRFNPLTERRNKLTGIDYFYIGIKKEVETNTGKSESYIPKTSDDLADDFYKSCLVCKREPRVQNWRDAIRTLMSADSGFRDSEIITIMDLEDTEQAFESKLKKLFNELSSGHKVVLLSITKLVEKIEPRTLILVDEPEAHLHPPLLSTYIRVLSTLLQKRDGAAIIATHSPIVLQEVPSNCVWRIRGFTISDRLDRETFGENIGLLTQTVFGLDLEEAGYYALLREKVNEGLSFEQLMTAFEQRLGAEAQAIVRTLIARRLSQL